MNVKKVVCYCSCSCFYQFICNGTTLIAIDHSLYLFYSLRNGSFQILINNRLMFVMYWQKQNDEVASSIVIIRWYGIAFVAHSIEATKNTFIWMKTDYKWSYRQCVNSQLLKSSCLSWYNERLFGRVSFLHWALSPYVKYLNIMEKVLIS